MSNRPAIGLIETRIAHDVDDYLKQSANFSADVEGENDESCRHSLGGPHFPGF
jgi:hypothetical protein